MLQQTRVEAVRGYFSRWMNALPDIPCSRGGGRGRLHQALGGGSATTAACATCTVQRSCCAKNTAANCLLITTGCLLCPASASTRQARWHLSRSDCPFRRWTATFCVWRRGWITISRRSRTQNSKKADARTVRRTHAVRPSRRPQPVADGAWCNRLVCRTARRTVTTARFSISARAFTAETRLAPPEPQKGTESGKPHRTCCALRSACRSAAETQKGSARRSVGASVARWPSLAGRAARGAHRNGLERAKAALCGLPNIFSPMWSGT